jgi:arylsulfatase A-like enzyme
MTLYRQEVKTIIVIGIIISLITGLLDISINISSKPSGLSSFSALLAPLSAATIFSLCLYLVLWFLVIYAMGNIVRLETIPLAVSFASFLGITITLLSLNRLIYSPLSDADSFKLFISVLCSLLISIGAYFTATFITKIPRYRNAASAFILSVPFLLAETAFFLWLNSYRMESLLHLSPLLFRTIFVLILLFTVALIYYLNQKINIVKFILALAVLIILGPILALALNKYSGPSLDQFTKGNNQFKHVILLTVDTLRADVLSCYGSEEASTPNIDQLSKDGILFTNAISPAPWTLPSLSSIMTGVSPIVHKVTEGNSQLDGNFYTLAEHMKDAGYFTAAIVYNGYLSHYSNLSQGFLEYRFFPQYSIGNSVGVKLLEKFLPREFESDTTTTGLTELAMEWIATNQDKDFFLWLHYYDPHVPYSPPSEFLPEGEPPPNIGTSFSEPWRIRGGDFTPTSTEKKWIRDLYLGEVRYVDKSIGKFLDYLKKLGLYDESLIVFTSDHGEEFWEHGGYEHGHSLFNEVIRVPLIIKLPKSITSRAIDDNEGPTISTAASGKIDETVTTQSIMPTILDISGIEYDANYLSSGSLKPLLRNPDSHIQEPIISAGLLYFEDQESVTFNGSKYIRFTETNREILYDLIGDPGERISVLNSSPQKAERARNILRNHTKVAEKIRENNGIASGKVVEYDQETKEKLKSLGYLQ